MLWPRVTTDSNTNKDVFVQASRPFRNELIKDCQVHVTFCHQRLAYPFDSCRAKVQAPTTGSRRDPVTKPAPDRKAEGGPNNQYQIGAIDDYMRRYVQPTTTLLLQKKKKKQQLAR
jgi:hypothetical protein